MPRRIADRRELFPIRVDEDRAAADQCDIRVSLEVVDLALDPVRERDVIGVEAREIRAARDVTRVLQRDDEAGVWLLDHASARVGGLQARERLRGPVGRTVVDRDDLDVTVRLAGDALDRLVQVRQCVVHRHHDAHER